jgi:hypothetical protein
MTYHQDTSRTTLASLGIGQWFQKAPRRTGRLGAPHMKLAHSHRKNVRTATGRVVTIPRGVRVLRCNKPPGLVVG